MLKQFKGRDIWKTVPAHNWCKSIMRYKNEKLAYCFFLCVAQFNFACSPFSKLINGGIFRSALFCCKATGLIRICFRGINWKEGGIGWQRCVCCTLQKGPLFSFLLGLNFFLYLSCKRKAFLCTQKGIQLSFLDKIREAPGNTTREKIAFSDSETEHYLFLSLAETKQFTIFRAMQSLDGFFFKLTNHSNPSMHIHNNYNQGKGRRASIDVSELHTRM